MFSWCILTVFLNSFWLVFFAEGLVAQDPPPNLPHVLQSSLVNETGRAHIQSHTHALPRAVAWFIRRAQRQYLFLVILMKRSLLQYVASLVRMQKLHVKSFTEATDLASG